MTDKEIRTAVLAAVNNQRKNSRHEHVSTVKPRKV